MDHDEPITTTRGELLLLTEAARGFLKVTHGLVPLQRRDMLEAAVARADEALEPAEPSDDQLANGHGMEGGIGYQTADARDRHDPSL